MAINPADLVSRVVRNSIGTRSISGNIVKTEKDKDGNIIGKTIDLLYRVGVSALKGVLTIILASINLGFAFAWGLVVSSLTYLANFDWNISDEQLKKQTESAWDSFYLSLGGALGNAAGWLICGIGPAALIFTFNEVLGLYLLKNVGEEALEELAGNAEILIKSLAKATGRTIFAYLFSKVRNLLYPNRDKNAKPWIFSQKIEEKIEKIGGSRISQILEELGEEFVEACIEAGYVLANSADNWLAMNKVSKATLLGPEKVVEIQFDRKVD